MYICAEITLVSEEVKKLIGYLKRVNLTSKIKQKKVNLVPR